VQPKPSNKPEREMLESKWWSIGGLLMVGLYLDRTNLSVGLPQISRDLGFGSTGRNNRASPRPGLRRKNARGRTALSNIMVSLSRGLLVS
jgi:hypothetical protein